jgi:hypothetical protein
MVTLMANPFYINPPDPLQALMMGVQGYEGASKRSKEADLLEARRQAGELAASGDYKGALGASFRGGDIQGANVLANLMEKQFGRSADVNSVYGTPIYGKTADGKEGIGTFDKQGKFRLIDTGGFTPTSTIKTIDLGTGTQPINSRTAAPVGPAIPKDLAGKERQEAIGQGQGQATVALPGAESKAQTALDTISKLETHPGKRYAIGVPGVIPGIPGTQQRDYIALLEQAKGQTFLQAFESLKGGGAITEIEGKKAEQAIARLDRAQSREGYDAALKDLRGVIERGLRVARQRANQPGQPQLQPSTPQPSAGGGIPPPPPGFIMGQ